MNSKAQITAGVAASIALSLLCACTRTHYVSIRHPLHVGQVDPNTVPFENRREERPRSLPEGTLTDEASLTELTPERICIHTTFWSLDEVNPERGNYSAYNIALLNDQDGVENTTGQIQVGQPTTQNYQGTIQQRIPAGWRRTCVRYINGVCVQTRREQVWRTVNVPHVWAVTDYPADMCFANGGFINSSTTRVALEVDARGPGRMVFEWQLESAAAGGQPQQQ